MMIKETCGSAFPTTAEQSQTGTFPEAGLTLRDYFAAKAMASFCSDPCWRVSHYDVMAGQAYALADAMLEARNTA